MLSLPTGLVHYTSEVLVKVPAFGILLIPLRLSERPTIDQLPHFPKPSPTNWTGKYKIDYGTVCVYPFEHPSCVRYWSDLISSPLHPWASCYRSMQGGTWQAWQGTREWTQHNSHYMTTTWLPSLLYTSAPLCPAYLVSPTALCLTGWSYSVVQC